ncbi:hypothetical protein BDR26DRAFT_1016415 [Obelidium mucronatum]|nr:hypothetical protein BDR26DRAFT_1016415 [Obelidium mucronatum]
MQHHYRPMADDPRAHQVDQGQFSARQQEHYANITRSESLDARSGKNPAMFPGDIDAGAPSGSRLPSISSLFASPSTSQPTPGPAPFPQAPLLDRQQQQPHNFHGSHSRHKKSYSVDSSSFFQAALQDNRTVPGPPPSPAPAPYYRNQNSAVMGPPSYIGGSLHRKTASMDSNFSSASSVTSSPPFLQHQNSSEASPQLRSIASSSSSLSYRYQHPQQHFQQQQHQHQQHHQQHQQQQQVQQQHHQQQQQPILEYARPLSHHVRHSSTSSAPSFSHHTDFQSMAPAPPPPPHSQIPYHQQPRHMGMNSIQTGPPPPPSLENPSSFNPYHSQHRRIHHTRTSSAPIFPSSYSHYQPPPSPDTQPSHTDGGIPSQVVYRAPPAPGAGPPYPHSTAPLPPPPPTSRDDHDDSPWAQFRQEQRNYHAAQQEQSLKTQVSMLQQKGLPESVKRRTDTYKERIRQLEWEIEMRTRQLEPVEAAVQVQVQFQQREGDRGEYGGGGGDGGDGRSNSGSVHDHRRRYSEPKEVEEVAAVQDQQHSRTSASKNIAKMVPQLWQPGQQRHSGSPLGQVEEVEHEHVERSEDGYDEGYGYEGGQQEGEEEGAEGAATQGRGRADDEDEGEEEVQFNAKGKPIKRRIRANREQLRILEAVFAKNKAPSPSYKRELADRLGIPHKSILYWFQNRRAQLARAERGLAKRSIGQSVGRSNGPIPTYDLDDMLFTEK